MAKFATFCAQSNTTSVLTPRHLIVATKPFYDDDDVKADPVYAYVTGGFLKGEIQPYLHFFHAQTAIRTCCLASVRRIPVHWDILKVAAIAKYDVSVKLQASFLKPAKYADNVLARKEIKGCHVFPQYLR